MTALLTDNLPLLAGAPNGIKKLRDLILGLAVRGKLVPQDPSDEPASELLKRIAEDKARLTADGVLKKQKTLPEVSEDEMLFELPPGWAWCRLQDAFDVRDGTHDSPKYHSSGYPLVTSKNLYTGKLDLTDVKLISEEDHQKISARSKVDRGDVLFAMIGSIGNPAIVDTDIPFSIKNVALLKQYTPGKISSDFLLIYLLVAAAVMREKSAGGVQSFVSLGSIRLHPFALPALSEQLRIVAKVGELMALCDRLEAQQVDAKSAHAQLVQALLDSLIQASDAADFAASWQRLAEHFHTLFTTESSIDALKQTLLQLAMMGKLELQDPSDEPAVCFLQRNGINSQPYTLHGWAEVPLGHLGEILGGSTPSKSNPEFWDGDIPWVSPKDMKRPVILDSQDHITAKALEQTSLKVVPSQSLLMVVRGMILAHSFPVAITAREVTINQDMKALVLPKEISTYLLMYLQAAKGVMVGLVDRSSHGTCKLISEKLWSHAIHLPPLFEQHRIVARVDQLMALCEQLKTRLTQARQLNEQLASTLVEQAVA
jgi:type I restriction enzyme S subunit